MFVDKVRKWKWNRIRIVPEVKNRKFGFDIKLETWQMMEPHLVRTLKSSKLYSFYEFYEYTNNSFSKIKIMMIYTIEASLNGTMLKHSKCILYQTNERIKPSVKQKVLSKLTSVSTNLNAWICGFIQRGKNYKNKSWLCIEWNKTDSVMP